MKQRHSRNRILVIRMSSLGDIVLTSGVFRSLKERFPASRVLALVKKDFRELLTHNPDVDHVIFFKGEKEFRDAVRTLVRLAPDTVLDLHGNLRSMRVKARLKHKAGTMVTLRKRDLARRLLVLFKWKTGGERDTVRKRYQEAVDRLGNSRKAKGQAGFFIPPAIKKRVRQRLKSRGFSRFITVAPDASRPTKQWDKYDELIIRLADKHRKRVVLIGRDRKSGVAGLSGRAKSRILDLTGRLGIMDSAAVVSLSDLLVCNDTGMMHIADSLKVPMIAIWGPTTREFGFFPVARTSRILEDTDLKCRPCSLHGSRRCPRGHFRCMKNISVNTVLNKIL